MLILVVDDDQDIAGLIAAFARKVGWAANVAASGKDALAYLNEVSPDLVISDFNMPGMTGIELLQAIKRNPSYKDIPFVLMTAGADINEEGARRAGCDGFLAKPFGLRVFQELLGRFAPR